MPEEVTSKLLLAEWSAQLATRTGLKLNVRPAAPDDQQLVLAFLKALNPEDLRFRFLGSVRPSEALARMLTQIDHSKVENLLAFDAGDGRLAATAMIAAGSSPESAEVAIMVRSDLKGKGIGWTLLGHACDYARARGFARVECIEQSDNRSAVSLEQEFGFESRPAPNDARITILSKELGTDRKAE